MDKPRGSKLFGADHAIVAMVHVGALPGVPRARHDVARICADAVTEASVLVAAGADALILENMHDTPYLLRQVGPEITATMTAVGCAVRAAVQVPLGVQVLAGANQAALAVAHACGAQFVRAEGMVFAHVADEGLMAEADAGPLLRYRRAISATAVSIWADVKKKHSSHAITVDVDLAETARAADFFGADAIIVTGGATGQAADVADINAANTAVELPVIVGSGVTPDNLGDVWPYCDAVIVGSYFKHDGRWDRAIDPARLDRLMRRVHELRAAPI